jgi:hypothetical protein
MMKVEWINTTREVYAAVLAAHPDMGVHGSITHLSDDSSVPNPRLLTDWGFRRADVPTVRRDDRDGVSSYYLALVTSGDES